MRTYLLLPFLLFAACSSKPKAPAVGTKELLDKLAADFRGHLSREYADCGEFGSGVVFDGKATYSARAFNKPAGATEGATLVFAREGDGWKCVDGESEAPGGVPACAWARAGCKR